MTDLTRRELLQAMAAVGTLVTRPASLQADDIRGASGATVRAPADGTTPAGRERINLDLDWRFHLGHASDAAQDFNFGTYQRTFAKAGSNTADAARLEFDDAPWDAVQLPHDWAVTLPFVASTGADALAAEDPNAAHGYKPLGRQYPGTSIGWYRRVLTVDARDLGRRIVLEFDGVFRDCVVCCNGHVVGSNQGGYSGFRIDLTDFLNYGGSNVLAVRVDASLGEGWFYEGAGIYRHVWLDKLNPLHIVPHGVQVISAVRGASAQVQVRTEVHNEDAAARPVSVLSIVRAPDGKEVARFQGNAEVLQPGTTHTFEQSGEILHPAWWSLEEPSLYTVHSTVAVNGQVHDALSSRFGIRTVTFDAQRGLFLNGRPVKIKGTCNHQDHAGVGSAIPDRLQEWRIEQLKLMGCNAYRSSHNPATPELLEICDRLGVLVIDEVRLMSSDAEALSQLERMVRRGRNHPSVILWSLGNEEPQMVTERGARIVQTMKQRANRLDPTRQTIFAMDKGFDTGVSSVVDVVGFNYRTNQMGDYHERFPDRPILGTETGSTVCTRGIYQRDDVKGQVRAYDIDHPWWASTAESWWSYVASRDYIAGGFIWTGFDYRGEPTPFNRWPNVSSNFGVLDTCGFPKDNFWYYQAQWTTEPVLHLFPHWNWTAAMLQDSPLVDVWCHTNLQEVELLVNGASQGRQSVPRYGHVEWRVRFVPGTIEARGYRDGVLVRTERRETAGPAARVRIGADRSRIRGDGVDLSMITVEITDSADRIVPTANSLVSFAISGPGEIIGVGNGDPTSHEADQGRQRNAFNGLCQTIVQSRRGPGTVVELTASSPGLRSARVAIDIKPA